MSGAAQVIFDVTNLTSIASVVPSGICFVQGQSKRGAFYDPSEVINSWPRFVELYGGLMVDNDTPLLAKRFLDKGGRMRFSRVNGTNGNKAKLAVSNIANIIKPDDTLVTDSQVKLVSGSNTLNFDFVSVSDYNTRMETYLKSLPTTVSVVSVKNGTLGKPNIYYVFSTTDPAFSTVVGDMEGVIVKSNITTFTSTTDEQVISIEAKYAGSDYNNVYVTTSAPNNGKVGYFNINVIHTTEPTLNVTYTNVQLVGDYNVGSINNLLVKFNVLLSDLNGVTLNTGEVLSLAGGTDATPVLSDYIGDSSLGNGFYAFDDYDDSYYLATFDDVDVDNAAASYVTNRGDITYPIILSSEDKQSLLYEKEVKNIDSKYVYNLGSGGGINIIDPLTNTQRYISPLADMLAAAVNSDNANGPWFSFAGPNRGILSNVLGVKKNFGTQSRLKDLNDLADDNINMVINRDGSTKLWGNFSGQLLANQERYFNVVKLVIFLKKALRPILEPFLEEPNDIPTWQSIYYSVKPLMDSLKNRRAIYDWNWSGDQFAKSMTELTVNNVTDVTQGKYKAILAISAISGLREIQVGIYLTEAGLEFEIVNQVNQ